VTRDVYAAALDAFHEAPVAPDEARVRAAVDAVLSYRPVLFDVPAERFRLSRRKGDRMPEGGVSCARPHRYGNPFIVATPSNGGNISRDQAVSMFRAALLEGRLQFSVAEVRRELRGRSLGCWCALDEACHVDVLLEVANG
jgi:hypothetical protein